MVANFKERRSDTSAARLHEIAGFYGIAGDVPGFGRVDTGVGERQFRLLDGGALLLNLCLKRCDIGMLHFNLLRRGLGLPHASLGLITCFPGHLGQPGTGLAEPIIQKTALSGCAAKAFSNERAARLKSQARNRARPSFSSCCVGSPLAECTEAVEG